MATYRIYESNGYDFEWTRHTVEAKSVHEARKIWAAKGDWRKFRVSLER